MLFSTLSGTAGWIVQNGYSLMFVVMLIEGPIITAAGAFAAALGYFNLWIVFLLSVVGNLIPDLVYYAIGYWGREQFIDKYGHFFGLTKEKLLKTEQMIERHAGKSLITIKLIPLLATPGLIAAGAARMDLKKYALWSLIITIPSSLFYLILGYYFGAFYDRVNHYLNIGGYVIIGLIVIFFIIVYFERRWSRHFVEKIEKE
jgi:membrane protein DedA with SNARE-associated domain